MSLWNDCGWSLTLLATILLLFGSSQQNSQQIGRSWTGYGISPLKNASRSGVDIAISSVSVLLPKHQMVYFPIESYNGCFKWSVSNPNLIHLVIVDKECGQQILIRPHVNHLQDNADAKSAYDEDNRLKCWLIAEEINSSRTLRTEVFLDDIDNLKIFTVTRNLYKDDTQVLQIQAFDSRGNVFSSIEGLQFKWKIVSDQDSVGDDSILIFQKFKDQHLEVSECVLNLEDQGKQSAAVIVKALTAGRAKVTAQLSSPTLSRVPPTSVSINVFEPLRLMPELNHIFLPPLSHFQFILQTIEKGYFKNISLPNQNYIWSSSNTSIVDVSQDGMVSTKSLLGSVPVFVKLRHIEDNFVKSFVNVVEPATIEIEIFSFHNPDVKLSKYVIKNRPFIVKVFTSDSFGNRIFPANSISFRVSIGTQHVHVLEHSSNFDTLVVSATTADETFYLNASMSNPRFIVTTDMLCSKELIVIEPITILPNIKRLLIPHHQEIKHSFKFDALGGTEFYTWTTDNYHAATINNNGLFIPQKPGSGKITCIDYRESSNIAAIGFTISKPVDIAISRGFRSATIGSHLILGVSMFDVKVTQSQVNAGMHIDNAFNNCSQFTFSWNIKTPSIFSTPEPVPCDINNTTLDDFTACSCVKIVALKEGRAKISVSFVLDDTLVERSVFIDSLNRAQVTPTRLLLARGSSSKFSVTGSSLGSLHKTLATPLITPEHPKALSIQALNSKPGSWEYSITCLEYGDQELSISIGNDENLAQPELFKTKLFFSCKPPSYSFISPTTLPEDVPTLHCINSLLKKHCRNSQFPPELLSSKQQYRMCSRIPVDFFVMLLDNEGRVFDSYDSLKVSMDTVDSNLLYVENLDLSASAQQEQNTLVFSQGPLSLYSWHRFGLQTLESTGSASLSYNVVLDDVRLKGSLEIQFLPDLTLDSTFVCAYLHPKNYRPVGVISPGSIVENLEVSVNHSQIVSYTFSDNQIIFRPVTVGIVEVSLTDPCLVRGTTSKVTLVVSEVHQVSIRCEKILEFGETLEVHVDVFGVNGHAFGSDQYEFMNIYLHFDGDSLDLHPGLQSKSVSKVDPEADMLHSFSLKLLNDSFRVSGSHLGSTTISVSIVNFYSRKTVFSRPVQIYVYAPLVVEPTLLELLPNSHFQLYVTGGPDFGRQVKFLVENQTLATISNDGILTSNHFSGNTSVTVSIVFNEQHTIATKSVDLFIKTLKEIAIYAPTDKLLCGESLIAYVTGGDGESPLIWNEVDLQFKWDVLNPKIVSLSTAENSLFSSTIVALSAGVTKVTVRVISGPPYLIGKFASFKITILPLLFEKIKNLQPLQLLMTPNSKYHMSFDSRAVSVNFVDVQNSVVLWDADNFNLASKGTLGHTFVHVVSESQYQDCVFQVDVEVFHHIQLVPCDKNSSTHSITVGSWVNYCLLLKNQIGRPFHSIDKNLKLKWFTSRQDVILLQVLRSIENSSQVVFRINGLKAGYTILRIQVANSQNHLAATFYLHLMVLNSIYPMNSMVHVGANINFHTSFPVDTNKSKIWYSFSSDLIEIDSLSGAATTFKPGVTKICYNSTVYTETTVKISNVQHISVTKDCESLTNLQNLHGACTTCTLNIRFFDENGVEFFDTNEIKQNFNMACKIHDVDAQKILSVETNEAEQKCIIKVADFNNEQHPPILTSVVLWIHTGWNEHSVEHAYSIPFIPAFSIISNKNVILSSRNSTCQVSILSSNPLQISIEEKLKVSIKLEKTHLNHTYEYQISVIDFSTPFDSLPIKFFDPETLQSEHILVFFGRIVNKPTENGNMPITDTEPSSNLSSFLISILIVTLTILIAYFVSIMRNNEIYYKSSASKFSPYTSPSAKASPYLKVSRALEKSA